jgi:hypothetical protein
MFVTMIHRIHDPEGFQAAEAKALEAGLPSHVALPIRTGTSDHGLGICIWEGGSVDAVREVVEGAVGTMGEQRVLRDARGRILRRSSQSSRLTATT